MGHCKKRLASSLCDSSFLPLGPFLRGTESIGLANRFELMVWKDY